MGNIIESLAMAICQAKLRDLPPYRYEVKGQYREARPGDSDIKVYHFPQQWGSSALGFNSLGGNAMTVAYTTIVSCQLTETAAIYFDGLFAYTAPTTSEAFQLDVKFQQVVSVDQAKQRYTPLNQ